jgi:peptidoglycan/xylan/chitin deacetylase (PgdA/CDA1 family)
LRIPGLKTAKLTTRRLLGRLRSAPVILGYHRVSDDPWDPFDLGVGVENFHEQMETLVELGRVIELDQLVEGRRRDDRRTKRVAVTFDDAYVECLTEVAPVLERFGIPATVFAISGSLGEEPWWDRLARILAPSRELPEPIELVLDDERRELFERTKSGGSARKDLTIEVHRQLVGRTPGLRDAALGRLARSLGPAPTTVEHRCLTADELVQLRRSGLVQVGSHGHGHLELGRLTSAEQRQDIEQSKRALEGLLGEVVSGISYPHGSSSRCTPDLVREAGFRYGCGSRPAHVLPATDPYDLPRIWVPDVDGERFRRWLVGWIGR